MGCFPSKPCNSCRTYAWLEVAIDGKVAGRLDLELRPDVVPRTVRNFEALCSGKGPGGRGYKGTQLGRIIPEMCIQGGECGPSIYGEYFKDENFKLRHQGFGTVYMANLDEPNTNRSQFFICLAEKFSLDVKFVAFGKVLQGLDLLRDLEALGSNRGYVRQEVTIFDCGTTITNPLLTQNGTAETNAV
eukprot:scaffold39802_cov27-Prasinocladus_malaysianus.AAC.1